MFISLAFVSTLFSSKSFADSVSYSKMNCSSDYDRNARANNYDCRNVYNSIKSFNQNNINSSPKKEKRIIAPYYAHRNGGEGSNCYVIQGTSGSYHYEKQRCIMAYMVETITRENQANNTAPDRPYNVPEHLQPGQRPNINYYDPSIGAATPTNSESSTFNLNSDISEGANNRVMNDMEVSKFQFKKSSCNNTSEFQVNLCYRTSPENAVIKAGE